MSIYFETLPHWGPAALFGQHPAPSDEDMSSDDSAGRFGPSHGCPPGHRGGPFGMRGGPFHPHGHPVHPGPGGPHSHHGHRGPPGPGGPGGHHGHPGRGGRHGHGPHGHQPGPHHDDPFGPMNWGRGGMFGHRGPHHGFHRGPHHGPHRGGRGGVRVVPVPRRGPPAGFDFLSRFAAEMGNGFQDFLTGNREANNENHTHVDFEPRADVFNTDNEYIIHVSLPGAQKPDISVEYNTQTSVVRIAGVVHRPEFSEELNEGIVWNERRQEVGVFERSFKFIPSPSESVDIDAENITAKMVDGVLIVRLPKTEKEDQTETQKKKIVVNEDYNDLYDAEPLEKENAVEHEKEEETAVINEKHASVIEVEDETDSRHTSSDTEEGDLMEEADKIIYTPSHLSEEDGEDIAEYVKVDTK